MATEIVTVTQTPVNLLALASGAPVRGQRYQLDNSTPHAILWLAEMSAAPTAPEDHVGHPLFFGMPRQFNMPTDTSLNVWVWADVEALPGQLAITEVGGG